MKQRIGEPLPMRMPAILFFLLSLIPIATAQRRHSNISLGSSLKPTGTSSWLSPSGLYAFGFFKQPGGYAVGIFLAGVPQKTIVWTANRDTPPVPRSGSLLLTTGGKLVLRSTQGQETTAIVSDPAAAASMLDSGNFVLYNSDQQIIWQSFDNPTNTIVQGQRLSAGAELFSSISETQESTGIFRMRMQTDGNLVLLPVDSLLVPAYTYWSTRTDGKGDKVTLNLDNDGHLYLLNATGSNIMDITSGGFDTNQTVYLMRFDPDGIFRLYSYKLKQNGTQTIVYESSYDKCNSMGLCGFNSYCVTNDLEVNCTCLPGFAPVIEGNWTSGCERNFSTQSCKKGNVSIFYDIEAASNTIWDYSPYSVLSIPTRGKCEAACLHDCNCEVAMFKDGQCRKHSLPLRFGRRQLNDTNIALVKVGKFAANDATKDVVPRGDKEKPQIDIFIVGASLIALAVIVLAISGLLIYRNHVFKYEKIVCNRGKRLSADVGLLSFTYAEVEKTTQNFREEVGKGAFGTVYKGTTLDGVTNVAVKRLDRVSTEGETEFQNEMRTIGRTHHRNLVRLLGYCMDGANRLLVYEYMVNGSLADVLFKEENQPFWNERMEIVRDIARGLLYLHEECETQIIHCDIKPQNILMDEHRQAKISDFGLAKLLKPNQTRTFTAIRGTRGYVAPEWHRKMSVTVKADVYSFGIVMLQIICCRQNVDFSLPEDEAILEEWVYDCFQAGELKKLVGDEEVDKRQLERMVKVGLWCILEEPGLRPSMKKVLLMMEGTVGIAEPPSPASFLSAI